MFTLNATVSSISFRYLGPQTPLPSSSLMAPKKVQVEASKEPRTTKETKKNALKKKASPCTQKKPGDDQPEQVEKVRAVKGGAKGWDEIDPKKNTMTKLATMAVLDRLHALAKKGNSTPLETYKNLPLGPSRVDFAMQLKMDRDGSWCSVTEKHSLEAKDEKTWVSGWLSEEQIANHECLFDYVSNEKQQEILNAILADLPSKPHDRAALAAMGKKLYQYSSRLLDKTTQARADKLIVEAQQRMKDVEDFDGAVGMLDNGIAMNPTIKAKTIQKTKKELTSAEEAKQKWLKEAKAVQSHCQKDAAYFLHMKAKAAKMVSKDKDCGVSKSLMAAMGDAQKELHASFEALCVVLAVAGTLDPDNFSTADFDKKIKAAKAAVGGRAELKAKVNRIVGR